MKSEDDKNQRCPRGLRQRVDQIEKPTDSSYEESGTPSSFSWKETKRGNIGFATKTKHSNKNHDMPFFSIICHHKGLLTLFQTPQVTQIHPGVHTRKQEACVCVCVERRSMSARLTTWNSTASVSFISVSRAGHCVSCFRVQLRHVTPTHSLIGRPWREVPDGAGAVAPLEEQRVSFQIQLQDNISTCYSAGLTPVQPLRMEGRGAGVLTVWRRCSRERGASWECSSRRL